MSYLAKTPEGLLPCPYCGGEARIIAKPYEPKVCVGCDDDTCLGFSGLGWLYDSDKEATEAWNRRDGVACEQRRTRRTCRMVDCHTHDTCVVNKELSNCSFVSQEFGYKQCSGCGAYVFDCPTVRYCPSCGALVIGEETGYAD